jgi:rubrerythrin
MIKDLSLKSCVEFAIATEETGARFYARLAGNFAGNQELASIFQLLGHDEEVHKGQFSELLNNLPAVTSASNKPETADYVRAMSMSEFFSGDKGPLANIDKVKSRDDALEKVFGFEKATLGFYQAVKDLMGENSILNRIIEAEKSHITRLIKIMITGERFRSLQDVWP